LLNSPFSHIYIEEESLNDSLTNEILKRLKDREIITIKHYKDIFNRKNQSLNLQKLSPKLILAKKRPPFIYEGSTLIQNFGYKKYLYAPIVQNCVYDCKYCILQGMYLNGNIVIFTNYEDFFLEIKEHLKGERFHLSISYDTDLLALEKIHGLCEKWLEFIANFPDIELELRTKSANFGSISHIEPKKNTILSWSLLPNSIIQKYDTLTPSLEKRVKDIKMAQKLGWNIRICIDPLIYIQDFESLYEEFMEYLDREIELGEIHSVALGAFRINSDYLKKIRKQHRDSDIIYYPFNVKDGAARYSDTTEKRMVEFVKNLLLRHIKSERIFIA